MKKLAFLALGAVVVTGVAAARFGGWAVVSIDNIPESATVGRPMVVDFRVRQHGVELIDGLKPSISARSGMTTVDGRAWETPSKGVYRANIALPTSGDWTITIESGFGPSKLKLLPLKVVDATARVAAMSAAERGKQLFAAKGCVTCHVHGAVGIEPLMKDAAPVLTDKRFAVDYLEKFLANPTIKPKAPNMMQMPNPGLRQSEIANIVAFINAEQRVTSR